MNPEVKQQWIAALRSGQYQQTSGVLRDATGFCCLGVACDISGLGAWTSMESEPDFISQFTTTECGQKSEVELPSEVQEWAGLEDASGYLPDLETRDIASVSLAQFNDHGLTFDQIADVINYFL